MTASRSSIEELIAVFSSDSSNTSIGITGRRRDTILECLRLARDQTAAETFTVPLQISYKCLADLITTFVESGDPVTRSWCFHFSAAIDLRKAARKTRDPWYSHGELYADPECVISMRVDKANQEDTGQRYLTIKDFSKGLSLLATVQNGAYAHHFSNILEDNVDASTADIFMQMVCYGEEVYA